MRRFLTYGILFLCIFFFNNVFSSSNSQWQLVNETSIEKSGERWIVPQNYAVFQLESIKDLTKKLEPAPMIRTIAAKSSDIILSFPMPSGCLEQFKMVKTQIMSPVLAAKFPEIQTYKGYGIDNPTAQLILDITPKGVHGMILRKEGSVFIDPYLNGDQEFYTVYYKKDFLPPPSKTFECGVTEHKLNHFSNTSQKSTISSLGEELRSYRLAVATTVEYSSFHGNTLSGIMAAIVTSINRVVGVYELELATTLTLIDNNDELIFIGAASDDVYTNNNGFSMLDQNQYNVDNIIGNGNYDVGHVFSTGGGGIADLGCICNPSRKAQGVTGSPSPVNDPFDIDYVAHEMGHQFGANHTFNGNAGGCQGNRNGPTAYEPGSGSTIMAYAGLCGGQNTQTSSDPYFHAISIDEIVNYTHNGTGNNCPTLIPSDNTPPVVDAGEGGFTIPKETPFELTGSATDEDGDAILYCWEQWDLGPGGGQNAPNGNAPLFRSFTPTDDPTRTFPRIEAILSDNNNPNGEYLPDYTRNMLFRLTARDYNEAAGGMSFAYTNLAVSDQAGPFVVEEAEEDVWVAGSLQSVYWEVANTDQAPINCTDVDIFLSTDGGYTFPHVLASERNNDGVDFFLVPAIASEDCRVKVKAFNNVFFDITPKDVSIVVPELTASVSEETGIICPSNTLNIPIEITATYGYDKDIELSMEGVPAGMTASFSNNPVNAPATPYLILEAEEGASFDNIELMVTATCSVDTTTINVPVALVDGTPPNATVLAAPENGVTITEVPVFVWSSVSTAETYGIEIASSPNFGTDIIEYAYELENNNYTTVETYTENNIFYWRIFSQNECGSGTASEIFAFRIGEEVAQSPTLVSNDFAVNQGDETVIDNDYLMVVDNDNTEDLLFTILSLPEYGSLLLNGDVLAIGDTFTQEDIDNGSLTYSQDGTPIGNDDFTFVVQDSDGGWIPPQEFDININLTTGLEDFNSTNNISVFPNPVKDFLFLDINASNTQEAIFELYNVAGQQLILSKSININKGQVISIDLTSIPKGMYVYQIKGEKLNNHGKLVVID